jgi:hypothetical protein
MIGKIIPLFFPFVNADLDKGEKIGYNEKNKKEKE